MRIFTVGSLITMIQVAVGIEHINDIIADFEQALNAVSVNNENKL